MKLLLIAVVFAVTFDSCNDKDIGERLQKASDEAKSACLENRGVPIFEPALDQTTGRYSVLMVRCDMRVLDGR